jgi:ATP-binding cassette, subfamily B (MDR/TAP), member 1
MDGLRQAPGQECARSAVPKPVGEGLRVVRDAYEWNRSSFANSALSAIETVKCFNGQAFELEQYKPVVMQAAKYYMKQALSKSLQIGFVRFITTAMFVQGFWYGSHLVSTGKTSAGDVLTTFWACLMATKAIEDILPHMIVLEK